MHLLQLLWSGEYWKKLYFREAVTLVLSSIKSTEVLLFQKVFWTVCSCVTFGHRKCFVILYDCLSISLCHLQNWPYYHVLETKLAQTNIWLVISTGSFENKFEALSIQALPIVHHLAVQEPASYFWVFFPCRIEKGRAAQAFF